MTTANYTDYIEFEHSDEADTRSEEETLLFPSNHLASAAGHEDKSFLRLFTDIWKVSMSLHPLTLSVIL